MVPHLLGEVVLLLEEGIVELVDGGEGPGVPRVQTHLLAGARVEAVVHSDFHDLGLHQVDGPSHVLRALQVVAEAAARTPVAGVLDRHVPVKVASRAQLVVEERGVAPSEFTVALERVDDEVLVLVLVVTDVNGRLG